MATQIDLYNGAAILLGKDPLFTDLAKAPSQSTLGQALHAAWPIVMPAAVRAHFWGYARGRQKIPVAEYVPEFGWASAYELPPDCHRAWDINFQPGVKRTPWEREGDYLLANTTGPVNLRFIRKIFDPGKFDADFTLYLTGELARFVAVKVTGSVSLEQRLAEQGDGLLKIARSVDAQERDEEDDDEGSDMLDYRSRFV